MYLLLITSLLLLKTSSHQLGAESGRQAIMECPFDNIKSFEAEKKAKLEKREREVAEMKANFKLSTFFPEASIVDKSSAFVSPASLQGKIVGIYFSAHWYERYCTIL